MSFRQTVYVLMRSEGVDGDGIVGIRYYRSDARALAAALTNADADEGRPWKKVDEDHWNRA